MALDVSKFQNIQAEINIASSVGGGKALYYYVVVDGPKVSYKVVNNKKELYLGDSSVLAAEAFNLADA
jgi:hypothetical protein